MQNRFQWLRVGRMSAARLAEGAARMLQSEYSEEAGWGFLLDEVRFKYVVGRFIERNVIHEELLNPLGNLIQNDRVTYTETRFRLTTEAPELEFVEPPRSKALCITQLSRAFDMDFTVLPIRWRMFPLLDLLESRAADVVVRGATITNLFLTEGISAKCLLTGESDVRSQLARFIGKRTFETSALKVSYRLKSGPVTTEFRRDGRAQILSGVSDAALECLRSLVSAFEATQEEQDQPNHSSTLRD